MEALREELNLIERVEFVGSIANPFPLYDRAAIFAFPSRWEGTPNALIEAMSCSLPVVVSNATQGLVDLVDDEVEGLVVPGENVEALENALARLAHDKSLRHRLGRQAKRRAAEFAPVSVFKKWDAALFQKAFEVK